MNDSSIKEPELFETDDALVDLSDEAVRKVYDLLDTEDTEGLRGFFANLDTADSADLLEKLDRNHRDKLMQVLDELITPEIYADIDSDVRITLLEKMADTQVAAIISSLESDDALDVVEDFDTERQKTILKKVNAKMRAALEEGLTFPEYSAGRLMQREVVAIPQFWTVGKTIDYMRAAGDILPDEFYSIYVVDTAYHVIGEVSISKVMRSNRSMKIDDLTEKDIWTISADMNQEDVARLFHRQHIYSGPVVDEDQRLLGVITLDDILDVIQEEAEDDILKLGGVTNESDIYKAVLDTTKSRFSWLAVNLLTAILASVVIGLFEATLEQLVALAILMPIVASMGGNAGTQTLTVAVRALATKELSDANAGRFIWKEVIVGLLNGIIFAVLTGLAAGFWFQEPTIGVVIGLAMIVNMIAAGLFGITIPIVLEKLKIDPALASSVFLTTVTDVVGFFAFLGLAGMIML